MKQLIRIILLCVVTSCSSLQEKRVIEKKVSREAIGYVTLADRFRVDERTEDALNNYKKAAKLFISKLHYKNYALIKLKIANLYSDSGLYNDSEVLIERADFCRKTFNIGIDNDVLAAKARLNIARKNLVLGKKQVLTLIKNNENSLEKRSYYLAMLFKVSEAEGMKNINKLTINFDEMFNSYKKGSLLNVETLIYVGKALLDKQKKYDATLSALELVASDLEIRSLSHHLLIFREKKSPNGHDKAKYQQIINDML